MGQCVFAGEKYALEINSMDMVPALLSNFFGAAGLINPNIIMEYIYAPIFLNAVLNNRFYLI